MKSSEQLPKREQPSTGKKVDQFAAYRAVLNKVIQEADLDDPRSTQAVEAAKAELRRLLQRN